ncbi:MAG: glycoside hydrolase family 25 protein [Burkholderiaceae bacterium]|jgi:lysozyme
MTTNGIDVSHYQGVVDWNAVADAGIVFAYCKASEGTSFVDTQFSSNWANTQSAGIIRGAYHFFRPSLDANAQAELFLSQVVSLEDGDLPPAVDVEASDGIDAQDIVDGLQIFLDAVQSALDRTPVIYTYPSFWTASVGDSLQFGSYPLWVANYGVSTPTLPDAWSTYALWQFSDSGTVSGVTGSVDCDSFNGCAADLPGLGS